MPTPADASPQRRAAIAVIRQLRDRGHVAYLAGGCVRDELLGQHPKDYDVATDATPDRVRELFPRTNAVGASFGVVLVRSAKAVVEVATFRSDGPYSDRRRPDEIHFSDDRADALRRDFTVNALFLDPLAESGDGVIDHVGGRDDLARRVIRAVGDPDQRLAEDHLRALRAVRFAARLGFEIHPPTADAITRHAAELAGVSRERIGDEVRRMLVHPARARAASLLAGLGLEGPVLRRAPAPARPTPALDSLGPAEVTPQLALAAWCLDTENPAPGDVDAVVARWREALCLTNLERDHLAATLTGLHRLEAEWAALPTAARKRIAMSDWFADALRLLRVRSAPRHGAIERDLAALAGTPGGLRPDPLLDGRDLIGLGQAPGPGFRRVLDQVYDAQLEGRVRTRAEALELARRLGV